MTDVDIREQHDHNMRLLRLLRDDHGWALSRILLAERLEKATRHVIADSPGTPDSVKGYLGKALNGESLVILTSDGETVS